MDEQTASGPAAENWREKRRYIKYHARRLVGRSILPNFRVALIVVAVGTLTGYIAQSYNPAAMGLSERFYVFAMSPSPDVLAYVRDIIGVYLALGPAAITALILIFVLSTFLEAPLEIGAASFFNRQAASSLSDPPLRAREVFAWYLKAQAFLRAFTLKLMVWVVTAAACVLFFAGPVLAFCLIMNDSYDMIMTDAAAASHAWEFLGLVLIFAAAGILLSALLQALIPAPYLLAGDPSLSAFRAIALSARLMRGHKWELLIFRLSFLPWDILVVLTMNIAAMYAMPYMQTCTALYVKRLATDAGLPIPGAYAQLPSESPEENRD